jgi:hypothetical protein
MKALLIFASVLAVGFSQEEAKAATVLATAPYLYGYPGYYGAAPLAYNPASYTYALPQTYAPAYTFAAPAPVAAPVVPVPAPVVSSQFAAQDEFGNTQYGYSNINSAKHEAGNALAGVSGSYQYVDANGELQTVTYVADALGFRTADSRLPVHDVALPVAPVYDGIAPAPVEDTPEVAAAKVEFAKAFEEVASRQKRESDPAFTYGYNSQYILNPRFQPFYLNGIYAYNHLSYMHHPRFAYGFYSY